MPIQMVFKEQKESRIIVASMPFNNLIRTISGKRKISTLNDFEEELEKLITKIEREYLESKESEEDYQDNYNERMSKLDFKGSKEAVEDGRRQLARTLELEVQLEFLANIKKLIPYLSKTKLKHSHQAEEFQKVANDIVNLRKINSRSNRHFLMKKIKKFLIRGDVSVLDDVTDKNTFNTEIEKILTEASSSKDSESIDARVDKIIEEIKQKKDTRN